MPLILLTPTVTTIIVASKPSVSWGPKPRPPPFHATLSFRSAIWNAQECVRERCRALAKKVTAVQSFLCTPLSFGEGLETTRRLLRTSEQSASRPALSEIVRRGSCFGTAASGGDTKHEAAPGEGGTGAEEGDCKAQRSRSSAARLSRGS